MFLKKITFSEMSTAAGFPPAPPAEPQHGHGAGDRGRDRERDRDRQSPGGAGGSVANPAL